MGTNETRVTWCDSKILPGHSKEVMDICWSNCGNYLVSASMDNRAILWNI
jgi:chromatin assembly factor 1 subunit B